MHYSTVAKKYVTQIIYQISDRSSCNWKYLLFYGSAAAVGLVCLHSDCCSLFRDTAPMLTFIVVLI